MTAKLDFSPEQMEQIRQMNVDGKTQSEIAKAIGVSTQPIKRVYKELGLKSLSKNIDFTDEQIATIIRMNSEGKQRKEISEVLGISCDAIRRIYRDHNLKNVPRGLRFTNDQIEQIKTLNREGKSKDIIAEIMGVGIRRIDRAYEEYDIPMLIDLKAFDADELATIQSMRENGKSQYDIADHFGVGRGKIKTAYKKLGLTPLPNGKIKHNPEMVEQIVSLYNDGYANNVIAEMVGDISPSGVYLRLKAMGITDFPYANRPETVPPENEPKLVALREKGYGIRALAKEFNVGVRAIKRYLEEHDMPAMPPPRQIIPPVNKTCTVCKEEKPIDQFPLVRSPRKNRFVIVRHFHCTPCFKLRKTVSESINKQLKKSLVSKDHKSCLDFLPYTILELKQHIETIFREPGNEWMTWDNWGVYRSDLWNDDDPATWTWQIDHIVPHASFRYTSMDEPTFRDCWALSNLRPYSSKQNILDNDRNIRLLDDDEAEDDWDDDIDTEDEDANTVVIEVTD